MNNKLLIFLSFLFLTGCATYQIRPLETEKTVWVKVKSANIRDGPSTANKVIAGAKWNDKLLVVEQRAKWYKVKLPDGTIGWIYEPLCSSEKLEWPKRARKSIGPYSTPDKFQFEVYQYFESHLWDLPPGKEAEDRLVRQTAQKFGIGAEEVNNIQTKIMWYEFSIQKRKPGYKIGQALYMTWDEFKKWVEVIGPPK